KNVRVLLLGDRTEQIHGRIIPRHISSERVRLLMCDGPNLLCTIMLNRRLYPSVGLHHYSTRCVAVVLFVVLLRQALINTWATVDSHLLRVPAKVVSHFTGNMADPL